jgi:pilus assembly protein CpaF
MSQATSMITDRVRERVRRDGVDLLGFGVAERYVRDEVQRYSEHALGGSLPLLPDEGLATSEVIATLTGFGPLQPYFDDTGVEEIWINAPDHVLANSTMLWATDLAHSRV